MTGSVKDEHYIVTLQKAFGDNYDLAIVSLLWKLFLTPGVAVKLQDFADNCRKPILICFPSGKFSKETASLFTEFGIPVFYS
ncbi:MAG TPA: hypothetical protein VGK06_16790 [Methanosarcina sp.]